MRQQNMPLVTAVIPVYNHEKYVAQSIRSILDQTYLNLELIIINDGSSDRSHKIISALAVQCEQRCARFEYINRENRGLSATLNQALHRAKGTYFTVLASDDVALPEKIEVLIDVLETSGPGVAAAFGNAFFIDESGRKICLDEGGHASDTGKYGDCMSFYLRDRSDVYQANRFGTYETLIAGNYLPAMGNLVRTASLSAAGGWTPGNPLEDWEMWLKLSRSFELMYVDQPVALYRWHDLNTVKTSYKRLTHASMLLIENERKFCESNDLTATWVKTYCTLAFAQLRDGDLPPRAILSLLKKSPKRSLLLFAAKRLARKLFVRRAT